MRLKRLVCRGFKSFADRTEFEFDAMLTGIIGPNGCGKSNVVDAIKWVLGDQRARSLRGEEMTDVIFKGAEGRDPLAQALVEITFEFPKDQAGPSELTIGRRLTLDKESEYLVNGEGVRLKDVRDLLLDTGLGVGAYMVMEQGRIDAILSANPESRRAIFEEAAGISRFKLHKRESLRKLERTEQNLSRVQDLLEERNRRIRSLKIHAGRARRYREIERQLRDLKSALAILEGRDICAQQAARREELDKLSERITDAEKAQRTAGLELTEKEQFLADEGHALEELQNEMHQVQSRLEGSRSRAETLENRAAELAADARASGERSAGLAEQKEERRGGLSVARNRQVDRERDLADIHRQLATRSQGVLASQKLVRDLQHAREALRDQILECIHQRTRARNMAHDQEAQIRVLDGREQRLGERLGSVTEKLDALTGERGELQLLHEELETRGRELDQQEATALEDLQEADQQAAELSKQEADLRHGLSEVSGRQQALEDMEAHMEGLDQGPRHLLEQAPYGVSRLLDRLAVDLENGAAVEAALGPFVQALLVDTRAHAEAILDTVQREKLGRVILLVEEELDRPPELRPQPSVADATALTELVRWSGGSRNILDWLLRGVFLVAELPSTPERGCTFVTRSGGLLRGPRMEGGAAEGQAGLVVRRAQIHALSGEAEGLRRRFQELLEGKDRVAERVLEKKTELRHIGETLRALRAREQESRGHLGRLEGRCVDLERESQELGLERRELRENRSAAQAALGTHLMNALLIEQRENSEGGREAELSAQLTNAQTNAQETVRAEQELRLRQVSCTSELDGLKESLRMQEEALEDLDRAITELDGREQETRAQAQRGREEATRCREEVSRLTVELTALQEERQGRSDALAEEKAQRWQMQETVRKWEDRRTALAEEVTALKLRLADLDHAFDRLEEKLREDTQVELRRCLSQIQGMGLEGSADLQGPPAPDCEQLQGPPLAPSFLEPERQLSRLWEDPDFSVPESRKVAQVLQAKKDRLGAVNLGAVQELEDEEERFQFLERETEDLREARRSLMETLRRLEEESKVLFETTFEKARANFHGIFRKLFQGGKADMFLQDQEDSLEAGIEIMARPPGKQLQSINLLSGGERSLTALAILFAVFKVKPSPVCILDEVDAALDDNNVERFLRVLRDFVGPTQFCIVTHHKRTMAECQVLYGITMQKRGVSSRIAVSLSEVDRVTNGGPEARLAEAQPLLEEGQSGL